MYQSPELLKQLPEALLKDSYRLAAYAPIHIDSLAISVLSILSTPRIVHEMNIVALRENGEAHIKADFWMSVGTGKLEIADHEEKTGPLWRPRLWIKRRIVRGIIHNLRDARELEDPRFVARLSLREHHSISQAS
jgi:hypothetical protein